MHLVKGHQCCPNFLAQPIRREEKFGPTSKLAIFEQQCKLNKQINRQISLALLVEDDTSGLPDIFLKGGAHQQTSERAAPPVSVEEKGKTTGEKVKMLLFLLMSIQN
jgi:hypothetical protein